MALLDENGAVVEQYQWEPYGSLATLDVTGSPRPGNSIGHQGLFFYRFDGADSLSLNAEGLYFNRNRWYSPHLGRFTSRDPNGTALRVATLRGTGMSTSIVVGPFDIQEHFVDGLNIYVSRRANPLRFVDPMAGSTVDITISIGFWAGYMVGNIAYDGKLNPSWYAMGSAFFDVGKNLYRLNSGPGGTGMWAQKQAGKVSTYGQKIFKELTDWADDRPWARRMLNEGAKEFVGGLFGGGIIAQAVIAFTAYDVGVTVGVMDSIAVDLGYFW